MYGFIEVKLAEIMVSLGAVSSFDSFSTSDGDIVAIIDSEGFDRAFMAIKGLAEDYGYLESDVIVVPSDVAGMRIILHPFWENDIAFDALTPGSVKESELYIRIRELPSSDRFVWNKFAEDFQTSLMNDENLRRDDEEELNSDQDNQDAQAESSDTSSREASPAPQQEDVASKFVQDMSRICEFQLKKIECDDGKIVFAHKGSPILNSDIYGLARKTEKHVIVIDRESADGAFLKKKIKSLDKKILKEVLFVHSSPDHPLMIYPNIDIKHTIFGIDSPPIAQLHGDRNVNSQYEVLTDSESFGVLFSEFEYVYRDYKTGVIWALQKEEHEIFFTLNMRYADGVLSEIIFQELGDRYGGKLSYQEMARRDMEYFQISSQYDRDNFVKLAVNNSKSIMKELRDQHMKAKGTYVDHMNKAMEYAKLAQRLEENILLMDEEKLASEENERCFKMFEDVLSIPQVSAVKVSDDLVHVYTKNIYVKHEKKGTWHDVGTFHIQIGMYGSKYDSSRTVKIFNTKHQIHAFEDQMQAPHVFGDGHLCHGNIVGAMIDAYKRRDLFQMTTMLIMFLQNANLDDVAGSYLTRWPQVSEEIATMQSESDDNMVEIFKEQSEEEKNFDEQLEIPIHV